MQQKITIYFFYFVIKINKINKSEIKENGTIKKMIIFGEYKIKKFIDQN
jgi:hypothetical protein